MTGPLCDALVLAGQRGAVDPLASAHGLALKALLPVAGTPMLHRVVAVLQASPLVGRITIAGDTAKLAAADPRLAEMLDSGAVTGLPPEPGPSASVAKALAHQASGRPLLVTTADHPLLSAAMIETLVTRAPADAAATAGVVPASVIRKAYPDALRTYWRFADDGYSGANLFLLRPPGAATAVGVWQLIERHRKRPWRIVARLGPGLLVRFVLRRLTLYDALLALSKRVGVPLRAVAIHEAEAAIDVDKEADLVLVESILRRRGA
ncbi:nucleotidyltransferase family protein [Marinivivus vitaminiproducens]|uniref:nucleotidyltransferase family protein n=1 Tax=Marinivivus vitaminiproducens TaxID=3035935 RepID=UPI00279ADF19|nr:nucleotidyltransferase family protein [Geminicoccaceae bacterium SCSIO 64248]